MSLGLLQYVTTTAKRKPARVFLYAQEKWGKSSWSAHAPAPIFLMTRGEDGLVTLMNAGRLPPTPHFPEDQHRWDSFTQCVRALQNEPHEYRTLVIDTANGAARLCQEHTCEERFNNDWSQYDAYGRGDKLSVEPWAAFLADLDRLREDRSMSVILLAHTEVKSFKNPAGPDYDRYQPDMPKTLWSLTHKWADVILFGSLRVSEQKVGNGPNRQTKTVGGSQRVLHAGESAAFLAGNRYGLPAEIPCGANAAEAWKNFATAMRRAAPQPQQKEPARETAVATPGPASDGPADDRGTGTPGPVSGVERPAADGGSEVAAGPSRPTAEAVADLEGLVYVIAELEGTGTPEVFARLCKRVLRCEAAGPGDLTAAQVEAAIAACRRRKAELEASDKLPGMQTDPAPTNLPG